MLKRRSDIPGFQEGGANVDPVSGNEVPTGSMPEEVRDDIDAKLSPGEFVLPADVVRFIGLERLMKMRDEAKKGLQRMSDIGQMGNADEVGEASNGTYEDAGFESEIDDILSEIEAEENGRDVNEQTEVMMAQGGFMKSGTDLTKAPKNPVFDVRYYKNAEGSVMYITHINGKPMTPIPEGYKAVTQEEAQKVGQKAEEAAKAVQTTNESGGYDATQLDKSVADFLDEEARQQAEFDAQGKSKEGPREQRMGKVSNVMETIAKWATPYGTVRNVMDFLKGPQRTDEEAGKIPIEQRTGVPVENIRNAEIASTAAYQRASELGLDEVAKNGAGQAAATFARSGMDAQTAARTAVEEQQNLRDIEANQGESSVGTPESTPDPFSTSYDGPAGPFGAAKGGLVNKRQYPSKKKRGKGIASAKA
jgi:Arc/MetJ-type ribon-helix-helix transcriptional regulator